MIADRLEIGIGFQVLDVCGTGNPFEKGFEYVQRALAIVEFGAQSASKVVAHRQIIGVEKKATLADALMRDPKSPLWVLPAGGAGEIPYDIFSKEEADNLLRERTSQ